MHQRLERKKEFTLLFQVEVQTNLSTPLYIIKELKSLNSGLYFIFLIRYYFNLTFIEKWSILV